MTKPSAPSSTRRLAFLAALSLLIPFAVSAQSNPSAEAKAPAKPQEEAIVLNPFSVVTAKDYGYRSTMSATASGSGMAVKDTPLSISIINAEFLADKNLSDVREALRVVPGLVASTNKEERDIYARGFSPVVKQDGADLGGAVVSSYFIDRIEVVKGPVSVLQGVASAGGVVNLVTRRPKSASQATLELGVGDYGYKKAFLSTAGPLWGDTASYIVEAARVDAAAGWVDYTASRDQDYHVGIEFKPLKKLSLLADVQQANRHSVPYQHLTSSNPDFIAAELSAQKLYDANGLPRPADALQIGESSAAWLARKGYPANTPTESINVNKLVYPNGYQANIQGPDALRDVLTNRYLYEGTYQISDSLYVKSNYSNSDTRVDGVNLSTFRVAGGLTIVGGAAQQRALGKSSTWDNQLFGTFNILGIANRVLVGYQETRQSSGTNSISGASVIYNPRTGPVRRLLSEIRAANPNGIKDPVLSGGSVASFYALDQFKLFNDRITTLFGARYSRSEQGVLKSSKTTPQIGVSVAITKSISAFAGYGESFRPNFVVDTFGKIVDPTIETNFEYGLKFLTPDEKFSGTVSVYGIDQKNVALRDFALEAATGRQPIYNVSGLAKSAGAEAEFIYAPIRNYQLVASWARNWQAETVVAQDVRQQGTRLQGAPQWQVSIWNKYTFVDGPLKGFYIGAGVQQANKIHLHPSWSSMVFNPDVWLVDATLGYQFKVQKVTTDLILRANNLTDKLNYDQTFRPGMPRTIQVLTRFKF